VVKSNEPAHAPLARLARPRLESAPDHPLSVP
jgi:hypothetical protein